MQRTLASLSRIFMTVKRRPLQSCSAVWLRHTFSFLIAHASSSTKAGSTIHDFQMQQRSSGKIQKTRSWPCSRASQFLLLKQSHLVVRRSGERKSPTSERTMKTGNEPKSRWTISMWPELLHWLRTTRTNIDFSTFGRQPADLALSNFQDWSESRDEWD